MANQRKKNAPQDFDIHRTLPAQRSRPVVHYQHQARSGRAYTPDQPPVKREPQKPPRSTIRRIFNWLSLLVVLLIIAVLVLAILIGVWDSRNISSASQKMFGSSSILSLARGGPLKTDANGRVNMLIVGYSADDPGHQGAQLTDSILVLSMNPTDHTGYLLSIPRDLYVSLGSNNCQDGGQYCKINEAYEDGGMSLLEQTVGSDFGININYYAIIDYSAVKDIVNALGGITINIQSPDPRGLYDTNISKFDGGPLLLKNGPQTLNGQKALNLTRARGDGVGSYGFPQSDFDRTQHQRQVFQAIKDKLDWKLILDPRKNSQILNAIATNVQTNIKISEARPIFGLFNKIPNAKLQSVSLNSVNGKDMLQSYITYDDEDALVPAAATLTDFSQIDSTIQQLNAE